MRVIERNQNQVVVEMIPKEFDLICNCLDFILEDVIDGMPELMKASMNDETLEHFLSAVSEIRKKLK